MLGRKREVTLHETASFPAEQSLHCFRSFRRSRFNAQNMVQCAAFGCNHNSGNPGVEVSGSVHSFHSFPIKRPPLLKKWLANIRRAQFTPTTHTQAQQAVLGAFHCRHVRGRSVRPICRTIARKTSSTTSEGRCLSN